MACNKFVKKIANNAKIIRNKWKYFKVHTENMKELFNLGP